MALMAPGGGITALREIFGELLRDHDAVRRVADLMAGADLRYDMGPDAHPLAGRFVPDLPLYTETGPIRLAHLMRDARPLLLDLNGGTAASALAGHRDRVDLVKARCQTPPAPALLIRPDGYVAWAGSPEDATLEPVLAAWFGPAGRPAELTG